MIADAAAWINHDDIRLQELCPLLLTTNVATNQIIRFSLEDSLNLQENALSS